MALTVDTVARYVATLKGCIMPLQLNSVWMHHSGGRIAEALTTINELEWELEIERALDSGFIVMVDDSDYGEA